MKIFRDSWVFFGILKEFWGFSDTSKEHFKTIWEYWIIAKDSYKSKHFKFLKKSFCTFFHVLTLWSAWSRSLSQAPREPVPRFRCRCPRHLSAPSGNHDHWDHPEACSPYKYVQSLLVSVVWPSYSSPLPSEWDLQSTRFKLVYWHKYYYFRRANVSRSCIVSVLYLYWSPFHQYILVYYWGFLIAPRSVQ